MSKSNKAQRTVYRKPKDPRFSFAFIVMILSGTLFTMAVSCEKMDFRRVVKVETGEIDKIGSSFAHIYGSIRDVGDDNISAFGHCWSIESNPDILDDKTLMEYSDQSDFFSELTGLSRNTTYHVRGFAIAGEMIIYGKDTAFSTLGAEDYDRNGYHTVVIGNQEWTVENLRSRHYSDGTPVDSVLAYNNDEDLAKEYGYLYNWPSSMRGATLEESQGICPDGWHLPSDGDFQILLNELGGKEEAHWKLMETGTEHWASPNDSATNESGFTALPNGHYVKGQGFGAMSLWCNFWTSTQYDNKYASHFAMDQTINIGTNPAPIPGYEQYSRKSGTFFSIRCVRD
jgi:uncharacterized protein (TIGR02145 family)